jgi:hypothetical protein
MVVYPVHLVQRKICYSIQHSSEGIGLDIKSCMEEMALQNFRRENHNDDKSSASDIEKMLEPNSR